MQPSANGSASLKIPATNATQTSNSNDAKHTQQSAVPATAQNGVSQPATAPKEQKKDSSKLTLESFLTETDTPLSPKDYREMADLSYMLGQKDLPGLITADQLYSMTERVLVTQNYKNWIHCLALICEHATKIQSDESDVLISTYGLKCINLMEAKIDAFPDAKKDEDDYRHLYDVIGMQIDLLQRKIESGSIKEKDSLLKLIVPSMGKYGNNRHSIAKSYFENAKHDECIRCCTAAINHFVQILNALSANHHLYPSNLTTYLNVICASLTNLHNQMIQVYTATNDKAGVDLHKTQLAILKDTLQTPQMFAAQLKQETPRSQRLAAKLQAQRAKKEKKQPAAEPLQDQSAKQSTQQTAIATDQKDKNKTTKPKATARSAVTQQGTVQTQPKTAQTSAEVKITKPEQVLIEAEKCFSEGLAVFEKNNNQKFSKKDPALKLFKKANDLYNKAENLQKEPGKNWIVCLYYLRHIYNAMQNNSEATCYAEKCLKLLNNENIVSKAERDDTHYRMLFFCKKTLTQRIAKDGNKITFAEAMIDALETAVNIQTLTEEDNNEIEQLQKAIPTLIDDYVLAIKHQALKQYWDENYDLCITTCEKSMHALDFTLKYFLTRKVVKTKITEYERTLHQNLAYLHTLITMTYEKKGDSVKALGQENLAKKHLNACDLNPDGSLAAMKTAMELSAIATFSKDQPKQSASKTQTKQSEKKDAKQSTQPKIGKQVKPSVHNGELSESITQSLNLDPDPKSLQAKLLSQIKEEQKDFSIESIKKDFADLEVKATTIQDRIKEIKYQNSYSKRLTSAMSETNDQLQTLEAMATTRKNIRENVLKPNAKIKLKNLKLCVEGYTEFLELRATTAANIKSAMQALISLNDNITHDEKLKLEIEAGVASMRNNKKQTIRQWNESTQKIGSLVKQINELTKEQKTLDNEDQTFNAELASHKEKNLKEQFGKQIQTLNESLDRFIQENLEKQPKEVSAWKAIYESFKDLSIAQEKATKAINPIFTQLAAFHNKLQEYAEKLPAKLEQAKQTLKAKELSKAGEDADRSAPQGPHSPFWSPPNPQPQLAHQSLAANGGNTHHASIFSPK